MIAQVVQHQEGHFPHLVEKLVIRDRGVGRVGGPEVVQQVRRHNEKDGLAPFNATVGYRYRQVSFPGPAGSGESQPTLGIFGILGGCYQGFLEHLAAANIGKGPSGRVASKVMRARGPRLL